MNIDEAAHISSVYVALSRFSASFLIYLISFLFQFLTVGGNGNFFSQKKIFFLCFVW